jgi:seryl-tRNA synthetase
MSKHYISCARCSKDIVIKTSNDCYSSEIDGQLVCRECWQKEQPQFLSNKIADLEAKLAEVKNSCDYYMKRSNDLVCEIGEYKKHIRFKGKEITKLKQQLAEKDKELEEVKKSKTYIMNFGDKVKEVQVVDDNQDKISFAVEQLNLLYKTLTTEDVWRAMKKGWWLNNGECLQLRQTIDNQIKAIKEMK